MKILICAQCGKQFEGKYAYFCPECRRERRADSNRMLAVRAGIRLKKEREEKWIENKLHKIKSKRKKEKLVMYENCPNFDSTSITCLSCPLGAWKFKGCGREK